MIDLCGRAGRIVVLAVVLSMFLTAAYGGQHSSRERDMVEDRGSSFSDAFGEGVREGVNQLQLARFNDLIDYSDVMVVRNLNSPVSMEIADYFVQQRGIPPENICNISTSANEVIDRPTFNDLMFQVINNMTAHGLLTKINIIVTTKGIPLKISESIFIDRQASVDSELALINGIHSANIGSMFWMYNPYFNSTERHSYETHQVYVVTRLTGYTAEDAKDLVDRATRGIGMKGRFVLDIDPRRDGSPGYKEGNDWMRVAYEILTSRGFQVFIDQNNTFVNNQSGLAGYTSWGSNDGDWYVPENINSGFETDSNGDQIPDGWFKIDSPGLSEVVRTSQDVLSGFWAVRMNRSQVNNNYTSIWQNVSLIPERRFVFMGSANLTNVSSDEGVYLQIKSYDKDDTHIGTYNGSVRSGTTIRYRGLGQIVYEPQPGIVKLNLSVIFGKSNGTVYVDNVRLVEIKPHNTWVDGAVGETYVSTGGRSFVYPTYYGQSLVADLIRDGVTGTKGYVYEPYLTAVAHPNILFERYTDGWALGESYLAASEIAMSWMDLILGDPKVAPYNSTYIPDLAVDPGNYTVSNDEIIRGTTITLEAIVENRGNFPAVNVTTSFYVGRPGPGGIPIMNVTQTIDYRNWTRVNVTWIAEDFHGEHEICVFVDPDDEFFELDEQNNIVCQQVRISDGIYLEQGWNLISLPLEPSDTNISEALRSIDGEYDMIRFYDPNETADSWKTYYSFKPSMSSDLTKIDRRMGFWIHLFNATVLAVSGTLYRSTNITLVQGWNLIGYPSLKDKSVEEVFAGIPLMSIETFSSGPNPYLLQLLDKTSYMTPGKGYWVNVAADCSLKVQG